MWEVSCCEGGLLVDTVVVSDVVGAAVEDVAEFALYNVAGNTVRLKVARYHFVE